MAKTTKAKVKIHAYGIENKHKNETKETTKRKEMKANKYQILRAIIQELRKNFRRQY